MPDRGRGWETKPDRWAEERECGVGRKKRESRDRLTDERPGGNAGGNQEKEGEKRRGAGEMRGCCRPQQFYGGGIFWRAAELAWVEAG